MIKTKKNRPYRETETGLKPFYTAQKAGVYLIYKAGELVYVGFSTYSVYKALYRHFQSWNDPRQQRITYNPADPSIKVRVIYTMPSRAQKLEQAIIIKYKPADNLNKYESYLFGRKDKEIVEEAESEFTTDNVDIPF